MHSPIFYPQSSILNPRFPLSRRAFSFAEVMFAVVILGIGFIMVAAVFPVAIRQTQSTGEENTAATAARTAATAIANLPTSVPNGFYQMYQTYLANGGTALSPVPGYYQPTVLAFPPTVKNYVLGKGTDTTNGWVLSAGQSVVAPPAIVVPFTGTRWNLILANIIQNTDPRFSYVPFYRRENGSSVAELIVIAVANRNRPIYDSTDINGTKYTVTVNTLRQGIGSTAFPAQLQYTNICPDIISIATPPAAISQLEGCTVAIQDNVTGLPTMRTYTLGRQITTTSPNSYELNGPDGMAISPGTGGWGTDGATAVDPNWPATADAVIGSNTVASISEPNTLQPMVAYATLSATAANPAGQMCLTTGPSSITGSPAAASGAFVIVADDYPFDGTLATNQTYVLPPNSTVAPVYRVGALNGRIFRLGQPIVQTVDPATGTAVPLAPGTFLLDPAYGMLPGGLNSPDNFPPITPPQAVPVGFKGSKVKVYIVGAGRANMTVSGSNSGAAQDMGVFATYFQVQ